MQQTMRRSEFLKKAVQAGLLALLAFIVLALKSRIATDPACSSCPEKGECPGRKKCSKN